MEAYSDFWVQSRQFLLYDKFGTVLGFDTQSQMERVRRSIERSGCASFEEWWNGQSAMFNQALDACGHDFNKLRLPKEYVLTLVNFRHFCNCYPKKEA